MSLKVLANVIVRVTQRSRYGRDRTAATTQKTTTGTERCFRFTSRLERWARARAERREEERRTRGEAMRSDGWRVETRDGGAEAETAAEQLKLTRRDGGTQLNQPNPVQYSTVQYVEVFDPIQSNAHANLHSA